MALRDILLDVTSTLGLDDLSDDGRKQYYIDKINTLAEELYREYELPDTLKEHVFQTADTESAQLSLPFYVGDIKGVRIFDCVGGRVDINSMRPRYHTKSWGTDLMMTWREKTKNGYLKQELEDFTPLTFTLKNTETVNILIDVSGTTDLSDRVSEVVTIPAGSLSAATVNAYNNVKFSKQARNTFNILVTDVNDNEVAEISNLHLRPYYTVIQLRDENIYTGINLNYDTFEIMYKERFFPMIDMADEYVAPNCDRIIFWKFAEWWESQQPGHEERALLANSKLKDLIASLMRNDDDGKLIEANFGRNRFVDVQKNCGYDEMTNPYHNRYIR